MIVMSKMVDSMTRLQNTVDDHEKEERRMEEMRKEFECRREEERRRDINRWRDEDRHATSGEERSKEGTDKNEGGKRRRMRATTQSSHQIRRMHSF